MKSILFFMAILQISKVNAQSIATAVDAKTASKLEQGEWVKISQTKAMYRLDLGAGSSCDMPRNPSVFIENNKMIVLGNVRHHTMCVENYKLYPPIYIEMDIQKNPDYAKMPVIYKQNSIEFYEGMRQDLKVWQTQVYYKQQGKAEYDVAKHRQVVSHFIANFKFEGTQLDDLRALLANTDLLHNRFGSVTIEPSYALPIYASLCLEWKIGGAFLGIKGRVPTFFGGSGIFDITERGVLSEGK